jgi:hypothetical protein
MEIHSLLRELGSIMGLASVELDERNACRLIFDNNFVVDLEASDDAQVLHLVGTIGNVPADADIRFMRGLLSANFMGQDTGNAALALDELNNEIVLYQRVHVDSFDVSGFVSELEAFVNRLEEWQSRLKASFAPHAFDEIPQDNTPFANYA